MPKVTKTVTIEAEQAEWLEEHQSINLSGLVQEKIDEVIEAREQYEQNKNQTPKDERTI